MAVKLQEASDMMHSDVRARLADAVNDAHRGTGKWASYIDHNGDGESGDCIYSCDGDIRSAPYEIQEQGGKQVANIDMANSKNVVPRTTYEEEADDDDNYASMMEAGLYTKGPLPLCERFISKGERDKADEGSFAGKGKSFPILKPGDVMAAVRSMGRAGSGNYGVAQLKANIIRIAKAKGWTNELPKTWRESARTVAESLALVESQDWPADDVLSLIESAGGGVRMKLKLIAPGKGSSAFYPAEVLKRDGPKVFTKGTHMYINHATSAEESMRPEGDWHKLAGALAENAYWDANGPKGEGLYAEGLFTSDYAPLIKEKAAFTGMSIRASGVAESGQKRDGVPVLKELTRAESVDVVTRAGAGGMILTESARQTTQEVDMTEADVKRLIESAVQPYRSRAIRGDANAEAARVLAPLKLHEVLKQEVARNVIADGTALPVKEGELDTAKFGELVMAEAKRIAAVHSAINPHAVHGMGVGAPIEPIDEAKRFEEAKRRKEAEKQEFDDSVGIFESLGMPRNAAELAAKGRAA